VIRILSYLMGIEKIHLDPRTESWVLWRFAMAPQSAEVCPWSLSCTARPQNRTDIWDVSRYYRRSAVIKRDCMPWQEGCLIGAGSRVQLACFAERKSHTALNDNRCN
jgi:hypothetical protein